MSLLVTSLHQSLFCWTDLCRMFAPELHVIIRLEERTTVGKDLKRYFFLVQSLQVLENNQICSSRHIHFSFIPHIFIEHITFIHHQCKGWDIPRNKTKFWRAYILVYKYLTLIFRRIMRMEIFSPLSHLYFYLIFLCI